ncbi:aminomethyl-transferring glycine dehydrogenase subunit GcvPB [Candidatus Desulfovibrio trichonymphae]|uniref:glycine dehydrogenase (aminomethyl-transferring) n=1 Tax=Candidatus Desulfovibrio trichonymphae TaxID=1725232 RepID=A0A1J1DP44_9BACT|nr:aminomethyl-transferring glycine dehydrogenase subunit GcvPB [Candidatus Desulfovibrio trichonymphae]BAV91607.1 glycine dehydrogenase subunit 2 [Candidatus Desulfovibrio trichonymphae]GHU98607.1 glycine dehydrogenase (aminomethyl-transferring) [Deltaproteobacteria bacterium]
MKTIFAKSVPGRGACQVDSADAPAAAHMLPAGLLRIHPPLLPRCSELDVVRHFTGLSQRNYSVDANFYPLGSCTMKYSPKFTEYVASLPGFARLHPLLARLERGEACAQGALQCLYEAERWLCEITGMEAFTLQPMAGANGEFTGVSFMAAYHRAKGRKRAKILIPDSAHGTNPASAALAGFEIISIESRDGMIDPDVLSAVIAEHGDDVAGLMMTCPNTLGLMELHLPRIVAELHGADALLYYDGANMNAIMGKMRVGDAGFDVVHLNLHKTFATPHGGGGPGSGPVGVTARLAPFLPAPRVAVRENGSFYLDDNLPQSIGAMTPFYGNFGVVLKALAYMLRLGGDGLARVAEYAVLNANYLKKRLEDVLDVPFDKLCAHEFVASAPEGLRALDIAKALLERGFHAPTVYFPLIVRECLMAEPTETESRETLDAYVEALREIVAQGKADPRALAEAPRNLPVRRLDETAAARRMVLTEDMG